MARSFKLTGLRLHVTHSPTTKSLYPETRACLPLDNAQHTPDKPEDYVSPPSTVSPAETTAASLGGDLTLPLSSLSRGVVSVVLRRSLLWDRGRGAARSV